jgi:hypothetical protein
MTLAELIAHVAEQDGCGRHCAEQQIRDALSDRKLFTWWEDAAMPRRRQPTRSGDSEAGPMPLLDRPPDDSLFWQQTPIREGLVFDPFTQRERRLLLLRFGVQQIWPSRTTVRLLRGKGGRPSYRDKIEEKLGGIEPTNLSDATRQVRETWSDNDGPRPHYQTIRRLVKTILGGKTRQN